MEQRERKRNFNYFKLGELEGSGSDVLVALDKTSSQRTTRYLTRYHCCGKEVALAHKSLRARIDRYNKKCRECSVDKAVKASARARTSKPSAGRRQLTNAVSQKDLLEDYGVTMPMWPVPRTSLLGKHVPWYDRAPA